MSITSKNLRQLEGGWWNKKDVNPEAETTVFLSHDVLEWGDYLGGSSDIQCSNARTLHNQLGVTEESDVIYKETGCHGYTRVWVRVNPAPSVDDFPAEEIETDDPEDSDYTIYVPETEEQRAARWEAHVREVLESLDDYPLFDDEDLSELVQEWAESAWNDYGRSDMLRELPDATEGDYPSFREWADDTDNVLEFGKVSHQCQHSSGEEFYIAEGGEGGIAFRLDDAWPRFVAHNLADYLESIPAEQRANALSDVCDSIPEERKYARVSPWGEFTRTLSALAVNTIDPRYTIAWEVRREMEKLSFGELAAKLPDDAIKLAKLLWMMQSSIDE